MIARLKQALANGEKITDGDASFYMHEIAEATMMDHGMSYREAHTLVLKKYDVSPFSVYSPEVIKQFSDRFSIAFKKFGDIN